MPIQIYVIGDGIGAGIQGAFYRYQVTSYGSSFITGIQDIQYVTSGTYTGRTALSIFVWIIGDIVLVITAVLALINYKNIDKWKITKICSLLIVSGVFFLISAQLQYGLLLYGMSGAVFPIGFVLIICVSWYFNTLKDFFTND
jgi:hypothetical protein